MPKASTSSECNDASGLQSWNFEAGFIQRLCAVVGSTFSQKAGELISNGDYAGYLALQLDPNAYVDPKHFAEDYLVASILKKSVTMPLGVDTTAVALQRFRAAESHNAATNERLWACVLPDWWYGFSEHLLRILGPLSQEVLEDVVLLGKHGNGGTVGIKGQGVVSSDKYDTRLTITEDLVDLWPGLIPAAWGELNTLSSSRVVRGSSWFAVLKDARTKRSCAKEPTANAFGQQGAGRKIVKRLKKFGVDLHDQRPNQIAAGQAHVSGDATIDLSQASDMNARSAVFLALCCNKDPQGLRWFHLLDKLRSKAIKLPTGDGNTSWHTLEMFSSMGNGFTFPLETAMFLALARNVVPKEEHSRIRVYGDDIIVPTLYAEELLLHLEFVGFQVNRSKTCLAGRFFESCGTDWLDGQNVRPFYLRNEPEDQDDATPIGVPQALIAANRLRLWLKRVFGFCDIRYLELWKWCVGQVPSQWNHLVPPALGDTGVISSQDEIFPIMRDPTWDPQREGVVVRHVSVVPMTSDKRSPGVMLAALARLETQGKVPVFDGPLIFATSYQDVFTKKCRVVRHTRGTIHVRRNKVISELHAESFGFKPTYGLEPMRGMLRRISTTKTTVAPWGNDLSWI